MKISEIPTDSFAAKLSDVELEELEKALPDSKKIGHLILTIQLEQIRRGGRKSQPKTEPSDDYEEALKRGFRRYNARYRLKQIFFESCKSRGRGKKKMRTAQDQSDFDCAADFALGLPNGFIKRLSESADAKHSDFLRLSASAWDAINNPPATESKISTHVRLALIYFLNLEKSLNKFPTKWEIQEAIEIEHEENIFTEDSDWNHVWKESNLDWLQKGKESEPDIKRTRRF